MSLASCENTSKGLSKKSFAQIRLKFTTQQNSPKNKNIKQIQQVKVYNNIEQTFQLADQNSEISKVFSRASSKQIMRSKKQKYRRTIYQSNQENRDLSNLTLRSSKKYQLKVEDQFQVSDNSIISKRFSVMESSIQDSHILLKKAFQKKQSKQLKSNSKQKFRKSRGSSNPRHSIAQSNTSQDFNKWIAKHISIDQNDSHFIDSESKVNKFKKQAQQKNQSEPHIFNNCNNEKRFSIQQINKYNGMPQKDQRDSYRMINQKQYFQLSNIKQYGSQHSIKNEQQVQDLQKMLGLKEENQNIQKIQVKTKKFVTKWQQKSVFIQKNLFPIKQETLQNDTSSTQSNDQQKCKTKSQIVYYPKKKNFSSQEVHDFKKKKIVQNSKDEQIKNLINENQNLKKEFQRFKNQYETKRVKKQIKKKKKQQSQCIIM